MVTICVRENVPGITVADVWELANAGPPRNPELVKGVVVAKSRFPGSAKVWY